MRRPLPAPRSIERVDDDPHGYKHKQHPEKLKVQLHGHLGYMNNDVSRYLRDAVGMRIAGGTSDIQRTNIFNQIRATRRHRVSTDAAPGLPMPDRRGMSSRKHDDLAVA